ncbi:hypothetical protein [Geobacter benzoatilyticus]|jgi:hypothetical protein|uniref:Uncharacterized protein n=1 Tax=Geobacter benzoatilyticus TaxID=2815309 RepID=A0ABX7Q448_9BACT|nr:hypothetical protein [Geobacter benzoatilyticus]QSV46224.1 hypothetical protein JZM60_02790 [Geobacter benzoatilyticus]
MPKDRWDKADIIAKIFATLLVPVVLATAGIYYNNAMKVKEQLQKDKEISLKNIEIAVGILNAKPTNQNQSLRDWAIKTINIYSEIKLSPNAMKLLKERSLPKPQVIYKENPVTIIDGGTFITDEKGSKLTDEKGNPLATDK